jgi:photosystem II stability/assembly factor-like uncharacterized protein
MRAGQIARVALLVAFGFSVGLGPRARAQEAPVYWQALGTPPGRVTHLAAGPGGKLVYAVSAVSSNRRDDQTQWENAGALFRSDALYQSQNGGVTWAPVTNNLMPGPISALYVDPNTGTLWAGLQGLGNEFTRRYGIWQSGDGGGTWTQVPLDRNDLAVARITRSSDGRYLYFGAVVASKYGSSYVYRSSDAGSTWTPAEVLRFGQGAGGVLADVVAHPSDPARLFVTTTCGEVYASTNSGESWALSRSTAPGPSEPCTGSAALAFDADQPDLLTVVRGGEADGALVAEQSRDGGTTWSRVAGAGLPARSGAGRLVSPVGGTLLLGTSTGTYRSRDGGERWQLLEGLLSSGEASDFSWLPGTPPILLAASATGVYSSRDLGALWQPSSTGLPFNSGFAGLLTDPDHPQRIFAITRQDLMASRPAAPLVMRSLDGGRSWTPAWQGAPATAAMAWAFDAREPGTLYVGSYDGIFRSDNGGISWKQAATERDLVRALVVVPNSDVVYAAGNPLRRSSDRGATWQSLGPILTGGSDHQTQPATGLVVDPANPAHLWAGLQEDGIFESTDGGQTWQSHGLAGLPVAWLVGDPSDRLTLYAGVPGAGVYRYSSAAEGGSWQPASRGLPEGSTVRQLVPDARTRGMLWASRDGGGVYRSLDRGETWSNVAAGLGDNLATALAPDYTTAGGMLLGTATAGLWSTRLRPQGSPPPEAADARIEIVWPHDGLPVSEARLANIGLRLFLPGSLVPPPCSWTPTVTVWQAVDTEPAAPLDAARQRSVDGRPFPFWELNDANVRPANDPQHKLYYMVRVAGATTATSIWAHGADPRTYFPQQDVPSGLATDVVDAVDARIQVVWPHDGMGNPQPVDRATSANVAVALFKHGTRLSVPTSWQPARITLYGAWNQEIGRPLAREAQVQVRQSGAIVYPVWEFNNIPVARAMQGADRLYLWVSVDGVTTYPTVWSHGADARTYFPYKDEPIQGCTP